MVIAALYCTDMKAHDVQMYLDYAEDAANSYTTALGRPDESGNHTDEKWEAAKAAALAETIQSLANDVLKHAGVTIINELIAPEDPTAQFHQIKTTVCQGFDKMEPVVTVMRPIVDIEAETYIDNKTGFGANE